MLPEATVRVPEDVLFQKLNEEMVLLDMHSGLYFGLNAVGARAWELLIEGLTLRGAEQQLLVEFEVAPEVLRADLEAWLAALRQRNLIAFEEQAA
jgi:Coenzyme PQQ synthesis protein D (PqqD)